MHFTISSQSSKIRLDKFLAQQLPGFSRSWIQKLITEGMVLVNQKKVASHYLLKENDKIKIRLKKPEPIDLSPKNGKLDIVFEDENFLVINKPAGLVVHPSLAHKKDTLINLLLAYYPKLKNIGENKLRPGIVHRLDKDVSGLMVIAKTQEAFEHLKNQFKNHQVKKEYLTLVHGKVKKLQGTITFSIGRSKKKGFKMIVRPKQKSRLAETYYEVISEFAPYFFSKGAGPVEGLHYTLLKVQIKTGRTHQIRVHLNAIGYPIVGEKIYKPRKLKTKNLGRLFLYACTLGFWNLDDKWREFKISLPIELKQLLKKLY